MADNDALRDAYINYRRTYSISAAIDVLRSIANVDAVEDVPDHLSEAVLKALSLGDVMPPTTLKRQLQVIGQRAFASRKEKTRR